MVANWERQGRTTRARSEAMTIEDTYTLTRSQLAILLKEAGWNWDYWGKFYSPRGDKYRDVKYVLADVEHEWKCPYCNCEAGCPCCKPGWCDDDSPYETCSWWRRPDE